MTGSAVTIDGVFCAQYLRAQAVATTVSCNTSDEGVRRFFLRRDGTTGMADPYVIKGIEQLIGLGMKNVVGFEPNGRLSSDRR